MQQVKSLLFIKHTIIIAIDCGFEFRCYTSMFEKLILVYHYCLHTPNMLLRRFANRINDIR